MFVESKRISTVKGTALGTASYMYEISYTEEDKEAKDLVMKVSKPVEGGSTPLEIGTVQNVDGVLEINLTEDDHLVQVVQDYKAIVEDIGGIHTGGAAGK